MDCRGAQSIARKGEACPWPQPGLIDKSTVWHIYYTIHNLDNHHPSDRTQALYSTEAT